MKIEAIISQLQEKKILLQKEINEKEDFTATENKFYKEQMEFFDSLINDLKNLDEGNDKRSELLRFSLTLLKLNLINENIFSWIEANVDKYLENISNSAKRN